MSKIVSYIVELQDRYSAIAGKIAESSKKAEAAAASMGNAINRAEQALARIKPPPALAGVPGQFERITAAANTASKAVATHSAQTQALALRVNSWAKSGGSSGDGLAGGIAGAIGIGQVKKAITDFTTFEGLMIRLQRVFPGTRAEFDAAAKSLDRLGLKLPISRSDIYKIGTEAVKSDVINADTPDKIGELSRYVALAAEFKSAFDLSTDQAATYLAKLKSSLGLSLPELRGLGDRMMWAEQKSAADPREILEIVRRNASLANAIAGKAGVSDILALGGAQVSAGTKSEVAATGMRTFLLRLQQAAGMKMGKGDLEALSEAGFSEKEIGKAERGMATARMALTKLGFNPDEFAKRMSTDLFGAVESVLKKIATLPKDEQGGLLATLAGMRSVDALKALVANPALLDQAKQIRDDVAGQGALARAYAANLDSLGASITRLTNAMETFKTSIVDQWKPMLKSAIEPLVGLANFMRENPLVSKLAAWGAALAAAAAGLGVLRFAASMLGWALRPLAPVAAGVVGALAGMARIGTWAYRFAGAAGVAALAMRALSRAFVGFALFEAVANWEKVATFVERLRAAAADPIKFKVEFPQLPEWLRPWIQDGYKANADAAKGQMPHDRVWNSLSNWWKGPPRDQSAPSVPRMSWGAGLAGATADREITVRSQVDVKAPESVALQGTVTVNIPNLPGATGGGDVSGKLPLSTSAPRGETGAVTLPGPAPTK